MGNMDSILTGGAGEAFIKSKTLGHLRWGYNNLEVERGVDALIEFFERDNPTGKFMFAQVKSGYSYTEIKNEHGYVFYFDQELKEYWSGCSLNVILIIYDSEKGNGYWQHISEKHIERTRNQFKLVIPFTNVYDASCKEQLSELFKGKATMSENEMSIYSRVHGTGRKIENFSFLVGFLDETTQATNNIGGHLRNFDVYLKGLFRQINDLPDDASFEVKKSMFEEYIRPIPGLVKRIGCESKIMKDSYDEGAYAYFQSLIILVESYGYGAQEYGVDVRKSQEDLFVLNQNLITLDEQIIHISRSALQNKRWSEKMERSNEFYEVV